jgi:hypothetical protein
MTIEQKIDAFRYRLVGWLNLPAKKDVAELARMTERFTHLFHSRYFPKQ